MADKFTWVQTHKELAQYLKDKEDEQKELVELLRKAGVTAGLVDEEPKGNRFDLEEIDPFSFFCFIYKYGPDKRLQTLQNIASELDLHYPEDEFGIPSAQAQKVMMFPFKDGRNDNEIENLWQFFYSALDDSITDKQFESILNQYGVGPVKITEALFYIDPETYLPINGPTKPYLKEVLNINPKFSTWQEYLDILNQIKDKTKMPFYELSYEAWAWNEEQKKTNYWVFQCNPTKFDVVSVLKKDELSDWTVDAHKDKIKNGDKVILWVTGKQSGCYALCETTSDVYEDTIEVSYKGDGKQLTNRVDLKVIHNLVNRPVMKPDIKQDGRLSDLNAGHQGTNFTATQEEYEALIELAEGAGDAMWNKLAEVVSKIDNERAVRKFFATVRHVLIEFDLSDDNEITYASSIKKYIQFTIGSRYVTHLERKSGKVIQGFYVDNDHLEELKTSYPSLEISDKAVPPEEGDMTWVYMEADDVQVEDFFEGIVSLAKKGIESQSKSQYRSIYPDKHNPWIAKVALDDDLLEKLLKGEKMPELKKKQVVNYPLNTIFYGPPGTGKTYTTIKRAAEIVEGRDIDNYDEAKQIFNDQLGEIIEFITFHQNYSYEDFIEGLRPDLEGGNQLSFKRSTGIFKKLSEKALKNYKESRKGPKELNKKKAFESALEALKEKVLEDSGRVRINDTAYFIGVEDDAFRYTADNWTLDGKGFNGFRMKYSDLLQFYENDVTERKDIKELTDVSGLSKQHASYFFKTYELVKDSMSDTDSSFSSVPKKNFVLIIDEINRANISRVFGELITLIEPDKRYGREMHIPAKLPLGESFSVPENLYIIGTMNTADKSIALLDIALRRRFEFEAMYPKYEIDGEVIHDDDVLKKINDRIKKLKGHDFQIGHSYFMKNHVTLKQRMNRRVIPLLLEYFMNDEKEVRDILTHAGLSIKEDFWPLEITGRV